MTADHHHEPEGLLRRDGHLTDLSVERHLAGELSGAERARVEGHLVECPRCAEALDAACHFEATLEPPAWARPPERRGGAVIYAAFGGLALAAALLLSLNPRLPPPETTPPLSPAGEGLGAIRVKAGVMDMEVFIHDGAQQRRAEPGARVNPGDRLGFRVTQREAGYLLIAGLDGEGTPYLCYPQRNEGWAVFHEGEAHARDLPEAVRMDDVRGQERLIGLHCPTRFNFEAVEAALRMLLPVEGEPLAPLLEGCAQRELRLVKP